MTQLFLIKVKGDLDKLVEEIRTINVLVSQPGLKTAHVQGLRNRKRNLLAQAAKLAPLMGRDVNSFFEQK